MPTITGTSSLTANEERLANALQSLGHMTRFKMFKLLTGDREMCVSEVAEALGISVPAASQHFRIFELNGLVDRQRDGQKICYFIRQEDPLVRQLISIIKSKRN